MTVRRGSTSLIIEQVGTVDVGGEQKIVHAVYNERGDDLRGLHRLAGPAKSLMGIMGPGRT